LPHDSVLAAHPSVEGAIQLRAQRQLRHVGHLLLAQLHALLRERLVLHSVEALLNVLDLGRGAVGCGQGCRYRRRHTVGTVSHGGACLEGTVSTTIRCWACVAVLLRSVRLLRGRHGHEVFLLRRGTAQAGSERGKNEGGGERTEGAMMGREESSELGIL